MCWCNFVVFLAFYKTNVWIPCHIDQGGNLRWQKTRFLALARQRGRRLDLRPAISSLSCSVASTSSRCHLDRQGEISNRPRGGFRSAKARFLASLRNDRGGGIMVFTLPGTTRFLAYARNDRGEWSKCLPMTTDHHLLHSAHEQSRDLASGAACCKRHFIVRFSSAFYNSGIAMSFPHDCVCDGQSCIHYETFLICMAR
jgi:hypothetical protein